MTNTWASLKRECDCATHQQSDDSRLVHIEQQCGTAFITLLDTLDVPPEHTALVNVSATVTPNSATTWKGYGESAQPCVQQFFFDTRRSFADLRATVASMTLLNHCMSVGSFPRQTRQVARTHRHWCQCRRGDCVGDAHRREQQARRFRLRRAETHKSLAPANTCFVSSLEYDVVQDRLASQIAEHEKGAWTADSHKKCQDTMVLALLNNWLMIDDNTGAILADDTPLVGRCLQKKSCLCCRSAEQRSRCASDEDDDSGEYDDSDEYEEEEEEEDDEEDSDGPFVSDCIEKHALPANVNSLEMITYTDLVADEAMRVRSQSTHSFGMCSNALRNTVASGFEAANDMLERLTTLSATKGKKVAQAINRIRNTLEQSAAVMQNTEYDRQQLELLLAASAHEDRRINTSNDNCQCLFEYYVRHCARQQLNISLLAQPNNYAYRDLGDTIWHINSPLMREMALNEYVRINSSVLVDQLVERLGYDKHAQPGEPGHIDSVIARNRPLREYMIDVFGPFTVHQVGPPHRRRVVFRAHRIVQRQHSFSAHIGRQLSNPRHKQQRMALTGQVVVNASYEQVLANTRRVFDLPDSVDTLAEAALKRGLIADDKLWQKHARWLPAAAHSFLMDHAAGFGPALERYAFQMFDTPANKRHILSEHCERGIVDELVAEPNRRMVMARIFSALPSTIDCIGALRQATIFCATVLAVIVQFDQLAVEQRKRANNKFESELMNKASAPAKKARQPSKKTSPPAKKASSPPAKKTSPPSTPKRGSPSKKASPPSTPKKAVDRPKEPGVRELQREGWTVIGAPDTRKRQQSPPPRGNPVRKSPRKSSLPKRQTKARYVPPPRRQKQKSTNTLLTPDAPPYVPLEMQGFLPSSKVAPPMTTPNNNTGQSLSSFLNAQTDFDFFDLTLQGPSFGQTGSLLTVQ